MERVLGHVMKSSSLLSLEQATASKPFKVTSCDLRKMFR
jgi:hypothetical protein